MKQIQRGYLQALFRSEILIFRARQGRTTKVYVKNIHRGVPDEAAAEIAELQQKREFGDDLNI